MPNEPATPRLGAAIRRLREQRGLNQEEVAFDAGVTVTTLARIERAQVNPTWTTVERIAVALGVSLAELGRATDMI